MFGKKKVDWVGGLKWATIAGVEPLKKEISDRAKALDIKPFGTMIQTASVRQAGFYENSRLVGSHSLAAVISSITDGNIEKPSQIAIMLIDGKLLVVASHEGMVLHDDYSDEESLNKDIISIFTKTSIEFSLFTNSKEVHDKLMMAGMSVDLVEDFIESLIPSKKTQLDKLIKIPKSVFYGLVFSSLVGFSAAAYYFYPDQSQQAVANIVNPEEQQRIQREQASALSYTNWINETQKNGVSLVSLVSGCLQSAFPMPVTEADGWNLDSVVCGNKSITQNWSRDKGTLKKLLSKHPDASYSNLNSSSRTFSYDYDKNQDDYQELTYISMLPDDKKVMLDYGSNIQTVNNVKGVKADIKESGIVSIPSYIGKPFSYKKIELSGENINHLAVIAKGFDGFEVRANNLTINIENKEKTKWFLSFTVYHQ